MKFLKFLEKLNKKFLNRPLINILTRSSNRPVGFARNRNSVKAQLYPRINHIVSYDNKETQKYLFQYKNINKIKIDRNLHVINDTSPDPNTGKYEPYNLYCNTMLSKVRDGWIMYLDDDDFFKDKSSLKKIVDKIQNDDTLIIWQMNLPGRGPVPDDEHIENFPKLGHIGSPCFLFHSKYKHLAKWDAWQCADYRVVSKLYKSIPNKVIIKESLVEIGQIGSGGRTDIT
jgi:hypothetical protein